MSTAPANPAAHPQTPATGASPATADPRFRRFVLLLALATATPMISVPLIRGSGADGTAVLAFAAAMAFFGGPGHVSMTAWFYADRDARRHFLAHPVRYGIAPVTLILATSAVYLLWPGEAPAHWTNLVFSVWLLWHYQRQNWGIHSFVSRAASGESASRLEDWILKAAVAGGIVAGIHSAGFGIGTPVHAWSTAAFRVGSAITMALPLLLAVAIATTPGLRGSPLRVASLLVGSSFFLPVFLYSDPATAFLPYALAHGLQYAVFMSYVATSTGGDQAAPVGVSWRPGPLVMVACVALLGMFLSRSGDYGLMQKWHVEFLFGTGLGITMAHFVIDAGIWRLRDEFPRRYVGTAFPFLPLGRR